MSTTKTKVPPRNYSVLKVMNTLLKRAAKSRKQIFLYFFFYTITASITPFILSLLPKIYLDAFLTGETVTYIVWISIAYFLIVGSIGFIKNIAFNYGYPMLTTLRMDFMADVFTKLLRIDYKHMEDSEFFEVNSNAFEATSSNNNGIEAVYHNMFSAPADILAIFILTVFIGRISPLILIPLIASTAIKVFASRRVHTYRYSKKEEVNHAKRKKDYYYKTTHDFAFGKDIRLYNLGKRILDNYDHEINDYITLESRIKNKEFLYSLLELTFLFISDIATYGILVYKVLHGMSIADFSMYLTAVTLMSTSLKNMIEKITIILNESQYVHDYYEFVNSSFYDGGGKQTAIVDDTLEIEFKNVSFQYPNTEHYVLKNLNLKIEKGEKLAIVGINGAGKSTIIKLLTGLFEVTEGEILINNIPIKNFNKQELYSMFSVVFQEINVLSFPIKENVACAREAIDEGRVTDCLTRVGLRKKIEELSGGIDHMMLKIIDPSGAQFSGGESQKLAIARALYKDANMVILDEPTAALDALAEAEIYQNFNDLVANKTAVYISHRLASTKFCDHIALFDKDGLAEYGSHEELLATKGKYYEMFVVQGKYYTEEVTA